MAARAYGSDDLPGLTTAWDAAVDQTPDVDEFCASTVWSFSAATSFPAAEAPVVVGDGRAFCGMRATDTEHGRLLVGLDPVWGFATPFVGPPLEAAQRLVDRLRVSDDWTLAVVAGQREDSVLTACLARAVGERWTLYRGPSEARLRADLSGGVDAWFARRSSRFRQRLRHLERDAELRGIRFVDVSAEHPDRVIDRVLAIEATSWKGAEETGLAAPDLADFYRQVCARLAVTDSLRALVATLEGDDVGFVLGGVRGRTYRGLQLSYHRDHADLGLGHLLQWAQLRRLEPEGLEVYDLGMDMEYKRRWADRVDETISVVVSR